MKILDKVYAIKTKLYEKEVKSIVPEGSLWGAIKSDGEMRNVSYCGTQGFALPDESVFVMQGTSLNMLQSLANLDEDTLEPLNVPLFKTIEATKMKVGLFEEVYKRGYIVFSLEGLCDFSGRPIVICK